MANDVKDLKEKLSPSQLTQLINEIVDEKMKSIVTKDELNVLATKYELKSVEELASNVQSLPVVYFTAQATTNYATTNTAIPFPLVVSDNNSGLVPETGIVHVKTAGVYHLAANMLKDSNASLHFYIMLNDQTLCWAYSNERSYYEMVSCSVTVNLKAGDQLFVKLTSGRINHGSKACTFTGFLISL